MRRLALFAALLCVGAGSVRAQTPGAGPAQGPRQLSGPRVGVTYLSPGTIDRINETFYDDPDREFNADLPVVTQFGWQFERQIFRSESGLTGVTEVVPLLGGLERGLLLPSVSFLVGARTPGGLEFGLGPNLSATGLAYAFAVGSSHSFGDFAVPLNLAVTSGRGGPRVSLLVGFTVSSDRY